MTMQDGLYDCKATGVAEYGLSDNGTDQIAVEVEIFEGPQSLGTRLVYLAFTDKAAPYAIDKLRALGFNGTTLADLVGLGSKTARCAVKTEEYMGKVTQKVDVFGERGPAFKTPMGADGQRKFAARFNGLLTMPKPAAGAAPQRSAAGKPTGRRSDADENSGGERFDDIPF